MKRLINILVLLASLTALPAGAQRAMEFDQYMIHYNALSSSFLEPAIAKAYGIRRSDSRALINIAIMINEDDETTRAVKALVTASGRNLTGQTRNVEMREIDEGDEAIYYIGELTVRNRETFDFTVLVTPEGKSTPYTLKFRQQFFTQ